MNKNASGRSDVFGYISKNFRAAWMIVPTTIMLSLCVSSCIPIDDLGEYWEKGVIDPRLEGHWRKAGTEYRSQDQYVSFRLNGKSYQCVLKDADEPASLAELPEQKIEVKSLVVGKHRFLMGRWHLPAMPDSAPASSAPADRAQDKVTCGLTRYSFEDGQLVTYALKEHVLPEAIRAGTIKGQVPKTTGEPDFSEASISRLDQQVLDTISEWADDPNKWKITARHDRVKDLDKALAESRRYPATSQTAASTTVEINLPDLKYLAEEKDYVLLRHLPASPEWEVMDEFEDIACYKRAGQSAGFESNWDTSPTKDEQYQIRYLFRFGKKPGGRAHWGTSLKQVDPLAGSIEVNLKSSNQGIESYLCVGQPGLWFEFFEQTHVEERRHTREALSWLKGFLADIRKAEAEIRRSGYAANLLPRDSVRNGKPSIEIEHVHGGMYRARAWVNPGAAGRTFMKFFDNKSNVPFASILTPDRREQIFANPKNRIGWSTDTATLFSYDEYIFVRDAESEKTYDARIELWFKEDKTGKETKLIETTHMLVTQERDQEER